MELLQLQADEGPCVECFRTAAPVSVADLAEAADRWPRFVAAVAGTRCLRLGARAAAAAARAGHRRAEPVPPRARGRCPTPTSRWARRWPTSPRSASCRNGRSAAARSLNEQLQTALNSRVIIEQAKGVLAQRGGLGMDAAFDRLRRYARGHNLRLAEVARQLVDRELDLSRVECRTRTPPAAALALNSDTTPLMTTGADRREAAAVR